ncbi:MAG TPA: helix-turn-helix domain-containing protein [Burkholderiales bacterium]|nr:helix-turn-helix domain-containing protein [Burkholderiales bacterium]
MSDIQDETAAAPRSPGRKLAAARAARGLTVSEIALRLKFSRKQIEALEADRYDALAGPAFVRGMVRAYAKLVGADADALVAELRASPLTPIGPTVTGPRGIGVPIPRKPRKGSLVYVVLSILVVVAVGGVLAEWFLRPNDPQRLAAARPAVPAGSATPAAPAQREVLTPLAVPAAAEPVARARTVETVLTAKRIELSFNRESWVEIRDAEGRVVFSQLNPPGTRRQIEGVAPFSVVIGNARGVRLRYNESDVDLMPFTRTDVARLTLD